MIEFKDTAAFSLAELFKELGEADFVYIEMSRYLEQLEAYRLGLHNQIKEVQNDKNNGHGLDSK